jgi:hypothetical protein
MVTVARITIQIFVSSISECHGGARQHILDTPT